MKSKESRPYLEFLKEYAFKKKLLPSYILTIAMIVLTAGVSLVRPELQGKVIDDLGNPHSTSLSAFMLLLAVFLGMLLLNYLMNYVQRYVVEELDEGKSLSEISDIKIDDLKFNYKPEGFALHIKFLNMKKGEIIGLKGESGSGKTTIVNLLMQLYLVDHGNIYINGIDCREFKIKDIRNKIGYVSQKSYFFEDTIRENLFGDYPLEEIELLASKLDIQEDIKRMENSYGYVLKKNGSNISGGQQKRIDILRVLLAEKDVLIFDEATANLDRKRRDDFFNVIMELKKEKIIIMITHNDLELNFFDKIYNV